MKLTLADTTSGYNLAPINNNFDLIELEFQNKVLYRDNPTGEPNQMENDIDMNSNNLLNTGSIAAQSVVIQGKTVNPETSTSIEDFEVTTETGTEPLVQALNNRGTKAEVQARVIRLDDITDFQNVAAVNLVDNYQFSIIGYFQNTDFGGGEFYFDASRAKADHNGGTIVSPTVPWDGTHAALADFLNGVGETDGAGTGVFVRIIGDRVPVTAFGARADDDTLDSTLAIQRAINFAASIDHAQHPASCYFQRGRFLVTSTIIVTGGVDLIGEAANATRIVIKRPFVGNVFENDTQGSYWIVKDMYAVHDVEASDSINGAFLYVKDIEFFLFENVIPQVHGELAIGINVDGNDLGFASSHGIMINCAVTGEAAGGAPYNPAWDPTANSARRAAFRLGYGTKNCTILGPFVESAFAGVLMEGHEVDGKVTKTNIVIGGTLNTCDRCFSFGENAEGNTVMQTELVGYPNNLYAQDVDTCKQNMAYNVRPFGEVGFSTYTKRNYLEFIGGSPTNPTKKIYGTDLYESDNESAIYNKTTSDGTILKFRRDASEIAEVEVTANSLTLHHATTAGSVNLSGGDSSGNGGNLVLRGSTGGNDVQVRQGGKSALTADTGTPAANETGLLVRYNNGTVESLGRVSVGAADSGGTGFRALRVLN